MLLFVIDGEENKSNYIEVVHEVFDAHKPFIDSEHLARVMAKCVVFRLSGETYEIAPASKPESIHVFKDGSYAYCFPFLIEENIDYDRLSFSHREATNDELSTGSLAYVFPEDYSANSSVTSFIGEDFIKSAYISQLSKITISQMKENFPFILKAMNEYVSALFRHGLDDLRKSRSDDRKTTKASASQSTMRHINAVTTLVQKAASGFNTKDKGLSDYVEDVLGIRDVIMVKKALFNVSNDIFFSEACIEEESKCIRKNEFAYTLRKDALLRYLLCLTRNHLDYPIAKLFSEMYRLKLVCTDERKQIFYSFERNRWNKLNDHALIRKRIEEDFPQSLDLFVQRLVDEAGKIDLSEWQHEFEETEREMIELLLGIEVLMSELEAIKRIRKICWRDDFSNKMFKMSSRYLHSSNFMKKLNKNFYLLGLSNGILDLSVPGNVTFRRGYPDDFVSMNTNVPFCESIPEKREKLMSILNKIFPDEQVLGYVLRFLASCLKSRNTDKLFSIWTGAGDNGKSVMMNLVSISFGEYCAKIPTSLIVGKRTASAAATPELCIIEGRRIVFAQEPSEGEKINPGLMKELTGGDEMYVRGLFEEGRIINIDAKLVLVSNKTPKINEMTRAVWSRIRVVQFESVFVREEEYEAERARHSKVFLRDASIDEQLKDLAPEFLCLLIEHYKDYISRGLMEPKAITRYTDELKMINDSMQQFIEDKIDNTKGANVSRGELYESYQSWLKTNYPKKHPIDIHSFSANMASHGYHCDSKRRYFNIKVK